MGGTQKAPPRAYTPPQPVPNAVRVYAHLHGKFDVACSACGAVTAARIPGQGRGQQKVTRGYDALTGVLTCAGCERRWYVGVILWAVGQGKRVRPEDHLPTPEEARELREGYREVYGTGWAKADGIPVPDQEADPKAARRRRVNLVCWCGVDCPTHGRGEDVGGGAGTEGTVRTPRRVRTPAEGTRRGLGEETAHDEIIE